PHRTRLNPAIEKWPAPRCSASAFARFAPFRTCRLRRPLRNSSLSPSTFHQADKDFLQRALRRVEVAEPDVRQVEVVEQRGDAGALALGVVRIHELATVARDRQVMALERGRDLRELLLQLEGELLPAELAH